MTVKLKIEHKIKYFFKNKNIYNKLVYKRKQANNNIGY
jgi:hypothetical protein